MNPLIMLTVKYLFVTLTENHSKLFKRAAQPFLQ